tara:strand:- start:13676 stop:15475 length:1800 start_codon:yes stop_codon:yes gene_type:complete
MSIVQKLTEGIVNRDLGKEGAALINKWEQTGLLEGLADDTVRNGMARLLENQAKELLRESSSMSGGDVEGFAAVAFPLVRRVFGSLIANDLVSVQPMSLPSGLIFFLDFTFGGNVNFNTDGTLRGGFTVGDSLYGGGRVGSQITGGVNLDGEDGTAAGGAYNLRNGYSSPTGSVLAADLVAACSGVIGDDGKVSTAVLSLSDTGNTNDSDLTTAAGVNRVLRFDPDLTSGSFFYIVNYDITGTQFNREDLVAIAMTGSSTTGQIRLIQRLSDMKRDAQGELIAPNVTARLVIVGSGSTENVANLEQFAANADAQIDVNGALSQPITDNFVDGGALGSITGDATWGLENSGDIPEIDIKVDSIAVTAVTKKLKAKWTPELGQDLNAYHNLDAEVELTQILSEQIALEIDREILEDLVKGAAAGVRYWSRNPGTFLDRQTGAALAATVDFTGNVSEWYETLIETINDVSAQVHRKTLRGAANFVVTSPEIANILEFTAGFRANVTADSDRGDAGAVKVGSLSKKFDILVDPYFPRNLLLVGRRGSSFLESGYVYAPYVPLQTTPTIFGVEDFVPRKGVMTRYAKKMVRPDMYGLVICQDLV